MKELFDYFLKETDRRFERIEEKLEDLTKFKLEMLATARLTSMIVSALCGIATMVLTLVANRYWGPK